MMNQLGMTDSRRISSGNTIGVTVENSAWPCNLSVVSEARFSRRGGREQGVLARFRYNDLKEAARGCGGRGPYAI